MLQFFAYISFDVYFVPESVKVKVLAENTYQKQPTINEKVHLPSKDSVSSSEIASIGQLLCGCPMWGTGFAGNSKTND